MMNTENFHYQEQVSTRVCGDSGGGVSNHLQPYQSFVTGNMEGGG